MRFGSLFAGIGGFDLGLERAGMTCAWQVEIDEHCQRVLQKHWPSVPRFGDIRECGRHNLEWVDLICGGFPCQDISIAGNKAGLEGERSGLWREMLRLVGNLRPRYVLVENVAELLKRGLSRVVGDLTEIGYDAEWETLPASAFGAPHQRDRLFLVAFPGGEFGERRVFPDHLDDIPRNIEWRTAQGIKSGRGWKRWLVEASASLDGEITTSDFCSVDDGFSEEVDAIKGLGNAVVPQVAQWIGERIMRAESSSK